jgi:hypothetical protein
VNLVIAVFNPIKEFPILIIQLLHRQLILVLATFGLDCGILFSDRFGLLAKGIYHITFLFLDLSGILVNDLHQIWRLTLPRAIYCPVEERLVVSGCATASLSF